MLARRRAEPVRPLRDRLRRGERPHLRLAESGGPPPEREAGLRNGQAGRPPEGDSPAAIGPVVGNERCGLIDQTDQFLERLEQDRLDDVPGRLGLGDHRLLGERVDARAFLGRRLVDDLELDQAGDHEDPRAFLVEVLVDDLDIASKRWRCPSWPGRSSRTGRRRFPTWSRAWAPRPSARSWLAGFSFRRRFGLLGGDGGGGSAFGSGLASAAFGAAFLAMGRAALLDRGSSRNGLNRSVPSSPVRPGSAAPCRSFRRGRRKHTGKILQKRYRLRFFPVFWLKTSSKPQKHRKTQPDSPGRHAITPPRSAVRLAPAPLFSARTPSRTAPSPPSSPPRNPPPRTPRRSGPPG